MYGGGGVLMATAFCHLIPETHDNYKLLSAASNSSGSSHSHSIRTITTPINNTINTSSTPSGTTLSLPVLATNSTVNATTTIMMTTHADHSDNSNNNNNSSQSIAYNALHLISSLSLPYVEVTLCCGFFFMYFVELLMVRFVNTHTHQHPCDTSLVQLCNGGDSSSAGCNNNGASASIVGAESQNGLAATMNGAPGGGAGDNGVILVGSGASSTTKGTGFYKFIRGLLIVSAFGAHSLFDGVAIGSQESVEKVWTVFAAISCHKLIIAAVVGLELYAATLESHLWTVVHLSLFSIMSPIGIVLVVVAQNSLHLDSNHPAMILLQSFATGTLLYIIFVEILQPKGDHALEKNRLGKSISLVAGFVLMLLVLTLMDEE